MHVGSSMDVGFDSDRSTDISTPPAEQFFFDFPTSGFARRMYAVTLLHASVPLSFPLSSLSAAPFYFSCLVCALIFSRFAIASASSCLACTLILSRLVIADSVSDVKPANCLTVELTTAILLLRNSYHSALRLRRSDSGSSA